METVEDLRKLLDDGERERRRVYQELRELQLAIHEAKPELARLLEVPGLPAPFYAPVRRLLQRI